MFIVEGSNWLLAFESLNYYYYCIVLWLLLLLLLLLLFDRHTQDRLNT